MAYYYNCRTCNDEWGFCPEDYDEGNPPHHNCPFCDGGWWFAFKEMTLKDFIRYTLRRLGNE